MKKRQTLATLCSLAVGSVMLSAAPTVALAQDWPGSRPVTLLVPFPPGGSTDMIARTLSPKFQEAFGSTFVVDNRPGAGGTVGALSAKQAAPDGNTIFVSSLGPFVISPHLIKSLAYDATQDFDYITVAVQAPNVLAVPANSPHQTFQDLLTFIKANPGTMTFASAGNGTSDHLTSELFWQQTGTTGVHVPYRGGAPAMADLIGGQVDATFMNINTGLPSMQAQRLRPLAITSTERSPLLPDVPTMTELGLPEVTVYSWQALAAPKGTPPAILEKVQQVAAEGLNDPTIRDRLLELGFEIVGNTPAEAAEFQAREYARWESVIEKGNITAN